MLLALKLYLIVGEALFCAALLLSARFRERVFERGVAVGCVVTVLMVLTWPLLLPACVRGVWHGI